MGHGRGSATSKQGAKRSGVVKSVGTSSFGMKTQRRDIDTWTAGAYWDVRKAQQGGKAKDMTELSLNDAKSAGASLEALIERSNPVETMLYRGVSMEKSVFDKLKVGGETSQLNALSSWTTDGGTAYEFAHYGGKNVSKPVPVIFVMPGGTRKGVDLTRLSSKDEGEVMVSSKARQRVMQIKYNDRLGAYMVGVDEI